MLQLFQIPLFHKCNKETLTKMFKQKNSSSCQTGEKNNKQIRATEISSLCKTSVMCYIIMFVYNEKMTDFSSELSMSCNFVANNWRWTVKSSYYIHNPPGYLPRTPEHFIFQFNYNGHLIFQIPSSTGILRIRLWWGSPTSPPSPAPRCPPPPPRPSCTPRSPWGATRTQTPRTRP